MNSTVKLIHALTVIGKYSGFAISVYFLIGIVFGIVHIVTDIRETHILVNSSYGEAIGPVGFIMRWTVTLIICLIQGLLWKWQILVALIALAIFTLNLAENLQQKERTANCNERNIS